MFSCLTAACALAVVMLFSAEQGIAASAAAINWTARGAVTPVKNQGLCGAPGVFAAVGNIESLWFLAGHPLTELSDAQIISCDANASLGYPFEYIVKSAGGNVSAAGGFSEHCGASSSEKKKMTSPAPTVSCNADTTGHAHIDGWKMLGKDEKQLASWLYTHGPFAIIVDATSWETYTGGVMTTCTGNSLNHAALVVGYDADASTPYWIVKNSWGTAWGENGYIRLEMGSNQCGMNSMAATALIRH